MENDQAAGRAKANLTRVRESLDAFEPSLDGGSLREQVRALVPAFHSVRDLGASLLPDGGGTSGLTRVLTYLRANVGQVIAGDELMVVSGIGEYPRRIRELRTEMGWPILSGASARQMRADAEQEGDLSSAPPEMQMDDYLLLEDAQDLEAAARWALANTIRRSRASIKSKVLTYLRANVGQRVTGDELRYLAKDKNEWPRRTRELRTEDGWPVVTRQSGDPSLPVGVYVLAADVQAPPHDRHIKEIVRRQVMKRDGWSCRWVGCGWSAELNDKDPRFLEVHHIEHHAKGGSNDLDNLVTLCNLHHDEAHRIDELHLAPAPA